MTSVTSAAPGPRIGFDIGGTFTDLILLLPDGRALVRKVPSSPPEFARAAMEGIRALLDEAGLAGASLSGIVHGTTVATNAILERKGALTGLITTEGFRDVLELGRLRMPGLYNLQYERPQPLVPRRLRMEVRERVGADGAVQIELDEPSVVAAVAHLKAAGVASIAVSLLHAYVNPEHERRVAAVVRRLAPEIYLSLSCEVDPAIGEFERTSTAVANAYVMPVIDRYVQGLENDLRAIGASADLLIMQSSGGTLAARAARALPVSIIESGPAAGVVATAALGARLGEPNMISVDIGGTTAKAAVIEDGQVRRSSEFQIGGSISEGSRLNNGGGFAIRAPAIDLAEVGAGGGSMVTVDGVGSLKIGPESAGAAPGPVCYDRGGRIVTVTDANLCLGYLNAERLPSGLKMAIGKAREALATQVADRLGVSLEDAAHGVFTLATTAMARAARAVTIERGRDPREFTMVAFGGNGPLFGVSIARALDIGKVIVPPTPGVFSAIGLLEAEVERHAARPYRVPLPALRPTHLVREIEGLVAETKALLVADGFAQDSTVAVGADMRYRGQSFPLRITLPTDWPAEELAARLEAGLAAEHERSYGFHGDAGAAEIVAVICTATIASGERRHAILRSGAIDLPGTTRRAYFGKAAGFHDVPVIGRADLTRTPRPGPLMFEEYDSTTLVPPGASAAADDAGNIVINTGASA
jgi:N-methylhydantoinase A